MSEEQLKESLMKGDYRSEDEDKYVENLIHNKKRSLYLKVGMGTFYVVLLVLSLFIV